MKFFDNDGAGLLAKRHGLCCGSTLQILAEPDDKNKTRAED
jgi:hypothetical protein